MPDTEPDRGYLDRRSARRYLLSLPITARVAQTTEAVAGMACNISVHGVYFITNLKIDARFLSRAFLDAPGREFTEGTEVFIRTQGRVVRVGREADAGRIGVAMVIQKYEIVRAKPTLS